MNLNQLTIREAKDGIKEKKFSVTELVRFCLQKIKTTDKKVKAFVTVKEDEILEEARLLEKRKGEETDKERYPLWGIPLAIKDNFLMQDLRTTASSKVLENFLPVYDSTVVEKLKNAGALILGKTNMDAWAHGSSTETSQFFTTRNPWDLNRLPGGSSGGSAAAVAADMTVGAVGSETAGSIRQPASWCGIVGFKPSYGVISRYGLIAMSSSLDCPGPMTKTVEDAKILFDSLFGRDEKDATSVEFPSKLKDKDLSTLKIGIPKEYFFEEIDKEVISAVSQAVEVIKSLKIRAEEISLINPRISVAVYTIEQRSEVSSNLARYDGIRYGHDRTFFGEEAKRRIMLGTYTLSSGYYDAYYLNSQRVRSLICQDFEKAFTKVDLIIAPTSPTTALPVGSTKESFMFGEIQDMLVEASSLAGLPGLSLNCGFSREGLPIGFQIIGPKFSENLILKLGIKFQQLTDWHKRKPDIH